MAHDSRTVRTRDARFQQWQALLENRSKRHRSGRFLIHGVRSITLAVEQAWPLDSVLVTSGRRRSDWAQRLVDLLRRRGDDVVEVAEDLMAELGGKDDAAPEVIGVGRTRPDDLDRIDLRAGGLVLCFDRPTSPGNLGTLIRSADAFGASGLVVSGHAADVYDPRTVRASTGSLFGLPVVRVPGPEAVRRWVDDIGERLATPVHVVGTDEHGAERIDAVDLTRTTVLAVGNETSGLSAGWREACDLLAHIPIGGVASSLNAATAGGVALYEAARQRQSSTTG